jgi:hypothetical protein
MTVQRIATMANTETEIRWPTVAGLSWIECDGKFRGIEVGGTFHAFEQLDIEQFEPKSHKDRCPNADCPAPFPPDFRGCPNCGAELVPMFGMGDQPWSFPGPDGDGLLNTERVEIASVSDPLPPLAAPEASDLIFLVAGTPRRLLAIDRSDSILFVYNRYTGAWREISSATRFDVSLPRFSWSVAAFEGGFAFPGNDSLLVAKLDGLGTTLEIARGPKRMGAPTAGPTRLSNRLVFLTTSGDGRLMVVSQDLQAGSWTKACDVSAVPSEPQIFAAPVTKTLNVFWAGIAGYVALRTGEGKWEASWSQWPDGFEPELRVRPIWTRNAFWQLGSRGGNAQFQELARGRQGLTHDEISGPHLTAGECSFASGMMLYVTPWDPDPSLSRTILANNDSFLMPIIGLKGLDALVADCSPRFSPGELLQERGVAQPAKIHLFRSGGRQPLVDMKRSISIANVMQLQAVLFDSRLLIYDSRNKCIHAWKFERK